MPRISVLMKSLAEQATDAGGRRVSEEGTGTSGRRASFIQQLKRVSFVEGSAGLADLADAGSDSDSDHERHHKGTFIDVDMMKEKVRKSLLKPNAALQDYYKKTGCSQAIARSQYFENITLFIIAFNALWIAHDTDSNPAEVLLDAPVKFQVAENLFCAYFSVELLVRFCAFESKCNCLRDAWFVFDSILVFMMVLETWVLSFMLIVFGSAGNTGGGDVSVVRVARLLRLTRMARMARLLRVVPELMILIKGMVAAVRSVVFTIVLLVVIMYIFAICLTQLAAGTPLMESYFGSVPQTMYQLLMHGCLLDAPKELSDALAKESWILPPIFWLFVLMAALTVMNMLVGVLCEVVSGVAAVEKEENLVNFVKGRVRKIVEEIDEDGNLSISKAEFCQILENRHACRALQDVGVDVIGLVDFADAIFEDDKGDEKPELSFIDFMDLVLQLRGSNVATVKDIVQLRKMVLSLTHQVVDLNRTLNPKAKEKKDGDKQVGNATSSSGTTASKVKADTHHLGSQSKLGAVQEEKSSSEISDADKIVSNLEETFGDLPPKLSEVPAPLSHSPVPVALGMCEWRCCPAPEASMAALPSVVPPPPLGLPAPAPLAPVALLLGDLAAMPSGPPPAPPGSVAEGPDLPPPMPFFGKTVDDATPSAPPPLPDSLLPSDALPRLRRLAGGRGEGEDEATHMTSSSTPSKSRLLSDVQSSFGALRQLSTLLEMQMKEMQQALLTEWQREPTLLPLELPILGRMPVPRLASFSESVPLGEDEGRATLVSSVPDFPPRGSETPIAPRGGETPSSAFFRDAASDFLG